MNIRGVNYDGLDPNYPVITYEDKNGVIKTIDMSTVTATGNPSARLEKIRVKIQEMLDQVTPLSSLSPDDPYVLSDPAKPYAFWDGNGNIVVRTTVVKSLSVDASGRYFAEFYSPF